MTNILNFSLLFLALTGLSGPLMAEIYRCNATNGGTPEYINNAKDAQSRGCKLLEGGNVTVVQSQPSVRAPVRAAASSGSTGRTDSGPEQKARDSDSRSILESELKKAEARLAEQQKQYNNGEPEKQGIEARNYQRYIERVAELKDGIARNQSDIEGIKREIKRLPAVN